MYRNLRLLGTVLVAVLGLGAAGASSASASFQAGSYPAAITGTQVGNILFDTVATELRCKKTDLAGELGGEASSVTLTASTGECSTLGGIVVMFPNMNGCTYVLKAGGELGADERVAIIEIQCPAGKEVVWSGNTGCTLRTPPQTIEGGMRFVNTTSTEPAKSVALVTKGEGISYTLENGNECVGSPKSGSYTNGGYTGTETLTAKNAETLKAVDFSVK
jgi:hypothetical protein